MMYHWSDHCRSWSQTRQSHALTQEWSLDMLGWRAAPAPPHWHALCCGGTSEWLTDSREEMTGGCRNPLNPKSSPKDPRGYLSFLNLICSDVKWLMRTQQQQVSQCGAGVQITNHMWSGVTLGVDSASHSQDTVLFIHLKHLHKNCILSWNIFFLNLCIIEMGVCIFLWTINKFFNGTRFMAKCFTDIWIKFLLHIACQYRIDTL